ncbi:MAG TPA: TauD/TfdA family dioxygenase, partial [Alphaproteobacteria bacterium]|nr:TauD/TfdA family dioxygenase [Alphaproteobacteria bacterium]
GIDVAALSDAEFGALYRLWLQHCLLVIRDQDLTPQSLVAFSARFGPLEPPPGSEKGSRDEEGAAQAREMWIISNVVENGRPIGALGAGEASWHTDMSYLEVPPTASVLYGHEVPAIGGNTWFANMDAALAAMPAELRRRIDGLRTNHDSSYTSAGELRKGMAEVRDVTQAPGAAHPVIRRHDETGREALYLGRRLNAYLLGLPVAESEALLDALWAWCTRPEFLYEHRWCRGDLLIWDNRSTIHRRDAFDQKARRVMWRCQVQGRPGSAVAAD